MYRSAARRAFSFDFLITQGDAVHRPSPMPSADSADVTGLEVAAGYRCTSMMRANVSATAGQILRSRRAPYAADSDRLMKNP
jgi:hypothetical protein